MHTRLGLRLRRDGILVDPSLILDPGLDPEFNVHVADAEDEDDGSGDARHGFQVRFVVPAYNDERVVFQRQDVDRVIVLIFNGHLIRCQHLAKIGIECVKLDDLVSELRRDVQEKLSRPLLVRRNRVLHQVVRWDFGPGDHLLFEIVHKSSFIVSY